MKCTLTYLVILFMSLAIDGHAHGRENTPEFILEELGREIKRITGKHAQRAVVLESRIFKMQRDLRGNLSRDEKLDILLIKDQAQDELKELQLETDNEIAKVKYLKGLQIIKILYEKVLSLDHHFASVRTLNEINRISNPNQYPEYENLRKLIAGKRDKRSGFDLTTVLGTNTIVSVVQTLTEMFSANLSRENKERELEKVECILDFTLRMQNDLNTIYFETAFLHKSNDRIKQEIELLFRDYTKPIGYSATLESCRAEDDWESITGNTEDYLTRLKAASGIAQYKLQVNIEFPINRLMQFITQYNTFIDQSAKFYEKFRIILNSYENEKQCESKLPPEYMKLKTDIELAITKFNVAYKPVEVNGTKMKEILYGLNEFD